MPETCLGSTCAYIHIVSLWVKIHLLPFAPFFAPMIAVVAGCIAVYSIHVTRSVARRRAAIDFFLKTDMDKGMVEAYVAFQKAVRALDKHREDGKSIETFIRDESGELSKNYQDLNTYLNIHELVAVGIKNKVFDETVCFNFWSDALVLHTEYTREFVDHIAASEGEEASYLELRKLSIRWKSRVIKWRNKQRKNTSTKNLIIAPSQLSQVAGQNLARPSQETTALNLKPPKDPATSFPKDLR